MYSPRLWAVCALALGCFSLPARAELNAWSGTDTQELAQFVQDQRRQAWDLRYQEGVSDTKLNAHQQMRAIMNTRIAAQFNARQIQKWIDRLIHARERDLDNSSAYNTAISGLEVYLSGGELSYSKEEIELDYTDWKKTLEPALKNLPEETLRNQHTRQRASKWIFMGWLAIDQIRAREEQNLANALNLNQPRRQSAGTNP